MGESVRVGRVACQVIGLLASKGQSAGGPDQDAVVLMPLTTFQRRISGNTDIGSIFVSAADEVGTAAVQGEIVDLLWERRRLAPTAEDDFNVRDTAEIIKTMAAATSSMTALLGAIAAVSLLVGGIGIMNIMLASVTERTREIGIRRAIGAKRRQIVVQFLIETVVLSTFGGLIGLGVGVLIPFLITYFSGMATVVKWSGILLPLFISMAIGILIGLYPAINAARVDPIVALRHE